MTCAHEAAAVASAAGRSGAPRSLRIALRTAHIGAACLVLGTAHHGDDPGAALLILLLTGAALVATDLAKYGWSDWIRYVQAWSVLLKLGAVVLGLACPAALLPGLWTALVVGSVVSHAPGSVRQRALWGADGPCAVKASSGGTPLVGAPAVAEQRRSRV